MHYTRRNRIAWTQDNNNNSSNNNNNNMIYYTAIAGKKALAKIITCNTFQGTI